jgi:hypothetical protein
MRKKQYMEEQTIGVPRLTGAGNSWPFLYQGMEHEITDPAPLYFDHGANVYNPMLQRELSQLGPQGIAGPPTAGAGDGGMGNGFGGAGPSQGFGNPGGLSGGRIASNLLTVASAYLRVNSPIGFDFGGGESPIPIPILGGTVGGFLQWLGVGGGSDHSLPRQMQKGRHYIWPVVGISQSLTPTSKSVAPNPASRKVATDPQGPGRVPIYGNYCGPGYTGGLTPNQAGPPAPPIDSLDECCAAHDSCYGEAKRPFDIVACNARLLSCAGRLSPRPSAWPKPPSPPMQQRAAHYRWGIFAVFGPWSPLNWLDSGL